MAEAVVEPRRQFHRFFCHKCNVEFEDVLQEYTCPFCATGFIERLERDRDSETFVSVMEDEEYSDADMSNIDDGSHVDDGDDSLDDITRANLQGAGPVLNDLAFLMSGGRIRQAGPRRGESRSLMEQLVLMIGGGRATGTVAGAPFVLVGTPGDYVFGGEGLDAVVTQLLGQLENTGPPPLPRDQIQAIPNEQVTQEQVDANMSCSVCWDNFNLGDTVSRLECSHIFHPACISPWLQLHATCPICRRSLLTGAPDAAERTELFIAPHASAHSDGQTPTISRVVVRRVGRRRGAGDSDSSGSGGVLSAITAQLAAAAAELAPQASASSLSSASDMYMDIDYD